MGVLLEFEPAEPELLPVTAQALTYALKSAGFDARIQNGQVVVNCPQSRVEGARKLAELKGWREAA